MKMSEKISAPVSTTIPSAAIDERLEKVIAAAIRYCASCSTEDLVHALQEEKAFPSLQGMTSKYDSYSAAQKAYDLTMISYALKRRSDLEQHLSAESQAAFQTIGDQASHAVSEAIQSHEKVLDERKSWNASSDFLYFCGGARESDRFQRMILFHALPAYYGPQAAPRIYQRGLKVIANFWGTLLDHGSAAAEALIFQRWAQTPGDADRFNIELTQLAAAQYTDKTYPEKTVRQFKTALIQYLLRTAGKDVSMRYHPDEALAQAGAQARLFVGMTTFPFDTRTVFTDFPEGPGLLSLPRVEIYNGRKGPPLIVPLEQASPDPTTAPRPISETKHPGQRPAPLPQDPD